MEKPNMLDIVFFGDDQTDTPYPLSSSERAEVVHHKGRTATDMAARSPFESDGSHNDDPALAGGYGR